MRSFWMRQHHDHIRVREALRERRVTGTAGKLARLRHEHRRGDDAQFANASVLSTW